MSKQWVNKLGGGINLYMFRSDSQRIKDLFGTEKAMRHLSKNAEKILWKEYYKAKSYIDLANLKERI